MSKQISELSPTSTVGANDYLHIHTENGEDKKISQRNFASSGRGTTIDLINSTTPHEEGDIVTTSGYFTHEDGGAGNWIATSLTGQPASQDPATLGSPKLNDGIGRQWHLQHGKILDGIQVGNSLQAAIEGVGSGGEVINNQDLVISTAILLDGVSRNLTNMTFTNNGKITLDDNIQRMNMVEAISGDNHTVRGGEYEHNSERGGFFSRHAVKAGITSNSGSVINGTKTIGSTSIDITATTLIGSVAAGDTFKTGVDTTIYTITNTIVTAVSNEMVGITFTPALVVEASDGQVVGFNQTPQYKLKDSKLAGETILDFDCLNVHANSAPFPLTSMYEGERFQFTKRVSGQFSAYEVDPAHTTIYTICNVVPMTAGGIGEEFLGVVITPPLTQNVDAATFITSIQDANNRYSNGIYLAGGNNPTIEGVDIKNIVWHGLLLGTGVRKSPDTSIGGDKGLVLRNTISNYGGNGIATADQTRVKIHLNNVVDNFSGVGNGIFPDSGSDGTIITNNSIDNAFYGIISFACDDLLISANTVENSLIGIILDQTADSNNVSSNIIIGDSSSIAGIYLRKGDFLESYPFTNTIVKGNSIKNIGAGSGIVVAPANNTITTTILDDVSFVNIDANNIIDVYGYGLKLTSMVNSAVSNNIVVRSGNDGIYGEDLDTVGITSNQIYNAGTEVNASGICLNESKDVSLDANIAIPIPATVSATDYGLEIGSNVTYSVGNNTFKGDIAQTNTDISNNGRKVTKTFSLDYASINPNGYEDKTVTVLGVRSDRDLITGFMQPATGTGLVQFFVWITANDTVTVRARNFGGIAVDLSSITFTVEVLIKDNL